MLSCVILNRNLGEVCDRLYADVSAMCGVDIPTIVVDSSTDQALASKHATHQISDSVALSQGLRFARGMNVGIQAVIELNDSTEWILLLPVDTEIVFADVEALVRDLSEESLVVAVRPMDEGSAYEELMPSTGLGIGWNFEEGPWIIRKEFAFQQMMLQGGFFFDPANFRGYLLSLDLAFRAYANGYCTGLTRNLVVKENATYQIEMSDLIRTEQPDQHLSLMLQEGLEWLGRRYAIGDPWSFAQIVRTSHNQFLIENPSLVQNALGRLTI